tara:strand:+ start:336 stop:773 length:438 start_codon:yes stop_codon:yes gene_type:complete
MIPKPPYLAEIAKTSEKTTQKQTFNKLFLYAFCLFIFLFFYIFMLVTRSDFLHHRSNIKHIKKLMKNRTENNTPIKPNFLVMYAPAKHEGLDNHADESYFYRVRISGNVFTNMEEGRVPVGISGMTEDGEFKRFRWDRINSLVAL